MEKKKILAFVKTENSFEIDKYRIGRLREESQKSGFKLDIMLTDSLDIFGDKILVNKEKELILDNYRAVYFLGNTTYVGYLSYFFSFHKDKNFKVWPSKNEILMRDKFYESIFLNCIDIKIPKSVLLNSLKEDNLNFKVQGVGGFPCVIKRTVGSCGQFVGLVNSVDEILEFVEENFGSKINGVKNLLLQEFVEESTGTDYRVFCIGEEVLGGIKRISGNGDFRSNVSLGGRTEVFELPEELKKSCKKIMKEGKFLFAGLDFIKSKDGWLAIEINTSAQFEGFERATGVNVAGRIIEELTRSEIK